MAKTLKVTIVSADRQLFKGEVERVVATASTGELGILAGHTPLLALLKPGQVRLTLSDGQEEVIYVSGGFIEVQPTRTVILADEAERAEALDEEKIRQQRAEAEARIRDKTISKVDHDRAEIMLMQTIAKMSALNRKKR